MVPWVECQSGYHSLLFGSEACSVGKESMLFFSVNLIKKHMAEEIIGPSLEYTAVVWLNGRVV